MFGRHSGWRAKLVVVLVLFLGVVSLASWTPQKLVEVAKAYGMSEDRAKYFVAELCEQCTLFNINPWYLFVLAIAESGLKNIVGDNGRAVGYFQLTPEAVWFVKHRYKMDVPKNHLELLNRIDLQIKIAVRYFAYLWEKYGGDLDKVLERWNGSKKFIRYYKEVAEYVQRVYRLEP